MRSDEAIVDERLVPDDRTVLGSADQHGAGLLLAQSVARMSVWRADVVAVQAMCNLCHPNEWSLSMVPKPASCLGCPLYGDGRGFVPDELVPGAEVLILAQNPGGDEERGERVVQYAGGRPVYESCAPAPLIGKTGYELTTTYLPIAGLTRGVDVSLANVLKCRWIKAGRRTNDLPPPTVLAAAVTHCTGAHLTIPSSVRLVVAMGALAWKTLGGLGTVTDWRGHLR